MTYLQLLKRIQSLPPERQHDTVTVVLYDTENSDEEWYPVTDCDITDDRVDVLDPGHLYLKSE